MAPQVDTDDDEPMVHDKPMSAFGRALFGIGTAAALADCERRRLDAIAAARAVAEDEDIEDRLGSRFPDLPAEYDEPEGSPV